MQYLKYDEEDLNSVFKPWNETEFSKILNYKKIKFPRLKSSKKMLPFATVRFNSGNSWDTIGLEEMQGSPTKHLESAQVVYDFNSFNKKVALKEFEEDIRGYVSRLRTNYITYIDEGLTSGTDIQGHNFFRGHLKALNDAYQSLKSIPSADLHKVQEIISKAHQESYLETYNYFSINYRDLYDHLLKNYKIGEESKEGSGAHDNILRYIVSGKDKLFFKFEEELYERNILNQAGNLWKLDEKKSLVMFFIYCVGQGIIRPHFQESAKPIRALEVRYNFDVGEQRKPNKWKDNTKYSFKMAEIDFSFLKNIK